MGAVVGRAGVIPAPPISEKIEYPINYSFVVRVLNKCLLRHFFH